MVCRIQNSVFSAILPPKRLFQPLLCKQQINHIMIILNNVIYLKENEGCAINWALISIKIRNSDIFSHFWQKRLFQLLSFEQWMNSVSKTLGNGVFLKRSRGLPYLGYHQFSRYKIQTFSAIFSHFQLEMAILATSV